MNSSRQNRTSSSKRRAQRPSGRLRKSTRSESRRNASGGQIAIVDLEVFFRVGVSEEERARPQRLLLTVRMKCDFGAASDSDDIRDTINYQAVAEDLLSFGAGGEWKLLEKLASDLAKFILTRYRARTVELEIKKFVIPQARYVSVRFFGEA